MSLLTNGLTVMGLSGPLTAGEYAQISNARDTVDSVEGLVSGGVPSSVGMQISVTPFVAYTSGVRVQSSAAISVTIAANTGAIRTDLVCLEINWSGTGSARVMVVQGVSGGSTPSITGARTAGGIWLMPLAKVTVRTNVTTIAAADVVGAAPRGGRLPKSNYVGITTGLTVASNGAAAQLASVTLDDPGYPYILDLRGECDATASQNSNSRGELALRINGTEVVGRPTPELTTTRMGIHVSHLTPGTMSGAVTASLHLKPYAVLVGTTINAAAGRLYYMQIPA